MQLSLLQTLIFLLAFGDLNREILPLNMLLDISVRDQFPEKDEVQMPERGSVLSRKRFFPSLGKILSKPSGYELHRQVACAQVTANKRNRPEHLTPSLSIFGLLKRLYKLRDSNTILLGSSPLSSSATEWSRI